MILQVIGEPDKYHEIEYEIEEGDFRYKTFISSDALRRFFESKGISETVFLFAPQSIVEKCGGLKELEKAIKDRGFEDFELVEFPSIGEYRFGDKSVRYKMRFEDVVVSMFLELLKRKPESVIVDVSTGQNVYVFALIEATRRYATYKNLEKILQKGEFKIRIATHQPVVKGVERVKVEFSEIPPRAFFSLEEEVRIDKLFRDAETKAIEKATEIYKKYSSQKSDFKKMHDETKIAFNSVQYSVPLAFYELLKFDVDVEEIEKSILEMVKEFLKNEISMSLKEVSNVFFSIAIFRSFREFKSQLSEPCVSEIEKKFSRIYENLKLNVNQIFLRRELENIKEMGVKVSENWTTLKGLYGSEGSADRKRNFFAHCGFLKEYTKVMKRNDEIYIKWDESKRGEIRKWLLKPKT
ncbi:MAG: TM1812 family CRISPR-associated protein [Archaeoglobaceae archaeon]